MKTKGKLHNEGIKNFSDTLISFAMTGDGCAFQIRFASGVDEKEATDTVQRLNSCWNAIESIGGDPETVGELREVLGALVDNLAEGDFISETRLDAAKAILDKTKVEL